MTQHQQVIQRDYYYEHDITWKDRLRFAAFTVVGHAGVYMFTTWAVNGLLEVWRGMALYVVFQVILTIPTVIILPLLGMHFWLQNAVVPLYSLSDDPTMWRKKAISYMLLGEAARFFIGLLPTGVTIFGRATSPITLMLYMLVYLNPFGRYDAVFLEGAMNLADLAVFLLIYGGYFAIHEVILLRIFKKRHDSHVRYLAGALDEYNREQDFYRGQNRRRT